MTMPPTREPTAYKPTDYQLERASALRRFNRIYVYAPIGIGVLAAVVLVGLLVWGSLSPRILGTKEFASALADLIVILASVPLILTCAVLPVALTGFYLYRRQQPSRDYGRLQTLFWRVDSLVARLGDKSADLLPRVANPVIIAHSLTAYLRAFVHQLRRFISRSE